MCNLYRMEKAPEAIARLARALSYPEGVPNFRPGDIRITEMAPIVRSGEGASWELVQRRWSWPGPHGKPVYNFRSEGRRFGANRCLIVTDGFYEFTTPADPKQKRKDRWLFTLPDGGVFAIAGIWRESPVGEAFTMLTTAPGPDVAPYHSRQVVVLQPAVWEQWLDPAADVGALLVAPPVGTLSVAAA